jgi:Protein of unknown function (DUF3723)
MGRDMWAAADTYTVSVLQSRVPKMSIDDREWLHDQMDSHKIFKSVTEIPIRNTLWAALCEVDVLIPSLYTLFEDLKYLSLCRKVLVPLLPSPLEHSIFVSLRDIYDRPHGFRKAYRELWAYAMRDWPFVLLENPRQGRALPNSPTPGFQAARDGIYHFARQQGFGEHQPQAMEEDSPSPSPMVHADTRFTTTDEGIPVRKRCGIPFQDSSKTDRATLQLQVMLGAVGQADIGITWLFVRRCFFIAFFGTMDDMERQEAERQEAQQQEAQQREAQRQEAQRREAQQQEAQRQEAQRREAQQQEAQRQEAQRREAQQQEAQRQEAQRQEAQRQEAQRQEAQQQEAQRQEAQRQEAQRQEAQRQEAQRREVQRQEAERQEAQRQQTNTQIPERGEAERRQLERLQAESSRLATQARDAGLNSDRVVIFVNHDGDPLNIQDLHGDPVLDEQEVNHMARRYLRSGTNELIVNGRVTSSEQAYHSATRQIPPSFIFVIPRSLETSFLSNWMSIGRGLNADDEEL